MYKFAINRPITIIMGVMTFIVFGIISFRTMPVNLFPQVDFPLVTIQTVYSGADVSTVESKVTDVIEEAVSGIDGIDKLFSTSYSGFSVVTIQFDLEKDLNEATNDVRDKIGSLMLPQEVEKPIVQKLGESGTVITLFVASKDGDIPAMMRFADEQLKPRLQRLKGVGAVNIVGFQEREIRVFVNPFLLKKYNLTTLDLERKIQNLNLAMGAGKIVNQKEEITLKTKGDASTIEQLKELLVLPGVRLGDIARVEDGLSDIESYSEYDGKVGVALEVKKMSGENTLDIIKSVYEQMPTFLELAGDKLELQLIGDQSEKILVNIDNVKFDLLYGAILAVIIVFLFLRNVRTTIISALSLPTSIIGTFAVINWLGYDFNKLTLIGLTLAIGIFIDDAIIVIENITKKIEEGAEPFKASLDGIAEIAFSVMAISAVLLSVFIPVAFMDGIVGMFFNSFAMTVASGVVISFLVAVMLIPTLSARFLNASESKFYHKTEPLFQKLEKNYSKLLGYVLRYKYLVIVGVVLLLILSTRLNVGMVFLPMEDNREFQVFIQTPPETNVQTTKEMALPLVKRLEEDQNVEYTILSVGYNSAKESHKARIYVKLKPVKERQKTQEDLVFEYSKLFGEMPNMSVTVEEISPFDMDGSQAPLQIIFTGSSLETLNEVTQKAMAIMGEIEGLVGISREFDDANPEIEVTIQRDKAQRLGIDVAQIASVLKSAYSSDNPISFFEDNGKEFDITLRLEDRYRESIDDLKKLEVRKSNGELVTIDSVVDIRKTYSMKSINRYDRSRQITVVSGVFGIDLQSLLEELEPKLQEIVPQGYSYTFAGDVENMEDAGAAFGAAVILALLLIYLILAALYESFIQPFIIMVAMPLSFAGVVVALYLGGSNFSIFVMIGIILLLGMVGKNAILVVDFANRAIADGKDINEALIEAGEKRLRPILMTTFALIGAMIPLAFSQGAGHEANSPMALAIIGGLISSMVLTLLVVPAIYKIMYPFDSWLRKWYERPKVS